MLVGNRLIIQALEIPVCYLDPTLDAIDEVTLAAASSQNLGLQNTRAA